jgi:hypothetical protein
MTRSRRRSIVRVFLLFFLSVVTLAACTKPVTTNVAPPAVTSLSEDQEIVGLVLTDGTEQLFHPTGPVLENGVWVGPTHSGTVQIPSSDVQQVIVQEEKTDVLSIVAIAAFVGLGIAAIAIASPQR